MGFIRSLTVTAAAAAFVAMPISANAFFGDDDHTTSWRSGPRVAGFADSSNGHLGAAYCVADDVAVKFDNKGVKAMMHGYEHRPINAGLGVFTIKNTGKRACMVDSGLHVDSYGVGTPDGLDNYNYETPIGVERMFMGRIKKIPMNMADYRDVILKPGQSTSFEFSWEDGSGSGDRFTRALAVVGGQNSFQAVLDPVRLGAPMNLRSGGNVWWGPLSAPGAGSSTAPQPKPTAQPTTKPSPKPKPTATVTKPTPKPTQPCDEDGGYDS